MKLALGSTTAFAVIAFSILLSIGYQFGPTVELVNAHAIAHANFSAGLTNGDEFKKLHIDLGLRYSLMKVMYFACIVSLLISTISGIVAKKRWITNG